MINRDLKTYYDNLYCESLAKVKASNFQVDNFIDSPKDTRFGITLLARPPLSIKKEIQYFLNELRSIEPSQYYYRNSDIHITIMSIISCYNNFDLTQLNTSNYSKIISESINESKCFSIDFNGITASPSAIMIQGYIEPNTIRIIRDNLRKNFKISNLEQSLDKRYTIHTAHSTVVRFRKEVSKKNDFIDILEKYRNYSFGTFSVNSLELVGNDWYQRKENVKQISVFKLKT